MKLIECYIENFGKLSAYRLKFTDGINEYVHENGYGKTTVTAFIRAMLYGLSDTKKSDLDENDRRHYLPWGGGVCGGWLSFSAGGTEYRIERTFGQKAQEDTFAIYDLRLGKETADYTENVGRELFGIDKDGFERTVFLSERNLSGKNDNKSISEKLSDTTGVDYDMGAMDEALKVLEQRRKYYYKRGGGGEIGNTELELKRTLARINELEGVRAEYTKENARLVEINTKKEILTARRIEAEKQIERQARVNESRALAEHYKRLADEDRKRRERLSALDEFFKNGVPTYEEIQNAKLAGIRSAELLSASTTEDDSEFKKASERFSGITKDEISDAMARELRGGGGHRILPIILGAALLILGVVFLFIQPLVSVFALIFGAFALVMSTIVGKNTKKPSKKTAELLNLIPDVSYANVADGLQLLYNEYVRFELLCATWEQNTVQIEKRLSEANALRVQSEEFLSRYKTESSHPFDEITAYVNERAAILAAISEFDGQIRNMGGLNEELPALEGGMELSLSAVLDEQSRLEGESIQTQRRLSVLEAELDNEDALTCAAEELRERIELYEKNLFYIQRAKDSLEAARDNMTARYLNKAKSAFEEYVSLIGEDVGEYMLDTSFEVSKNEYGASRRTEAYSLGIRNMQYLATRLAITDALYENEEPFLIFDDPFISFDDEHTKRAAEVLKRLAKKRQIIYFTCSSSRKIRT